MFGWVLDTSLKGARLAKQEIFILRLMTTLDWFKKIAQIELKLKHDKKNFILFTITQVMLLTTFSQTKSWWYFFPSTKIFHTSEGNFNFLFFGPLPLGEKGSYDFTTISLPVGQ